MYDGKIALSALQARNRTKHYVGNAPPMRALPLAFVPEAKLLLLHRRNADASHPHPKGRLASLAIALAARRFILQRCDRHSLISAVLQDLRRMLTEATKQDRQEMEDVEFEPYLQSVDALPPPGPIDQAYTDFLAPTTLEMLCGPQPVWNLPQDVRVVHGLGADAQRTVGCVLYLLKHSSTGQVLRLLRQSCYIGGDVDSLAALCLAFVVSFISFIIFMTFFHHHCV